MIQTLSKILFFIDQGQVIIWTYDDFFHCTSKVIFLRNFKGLLNIHTKYLAHTLNEVYFILKSS